MANKTLNQIRVEIALRAKNAIGGGAEGGDKIKNYPTMIQNNGLLAALAYSAEYNDKIHEYKNKAEYNMSKYVCDYLNELTQCNYSVTAGESIGDLGTLITFLSKCTPEQFRRINSEVMAFMNYFRRFAS